MKYLLKISDVTVSKFPTLQIFEELLDNSEEIIFFPAAASFSVVRSKLRCVGWVLGKRGGLTNCNCPSNISQIKSQPTKSLFDDKCFATFV